jgi:putative ABC transport system permease protein
MTALDRKLLRDFRHLKGQSLAICLVIASGVATFVMSLATLASMQQTQQTYYDRYRFAHVFAQVKRAPNHLGERIAEIPGVGQVQTRIVVDVTLAVPGLAEPAVGRLISVPEHTRPGINALYLRRGRYVEPSRAEEVLVSEAFANAHGFEPGATLQAIINNRKQTLRIVGVVLCPEYVLQIRGGDLLPDEKRFGVFWMGYEALAAAFNMDGAFNDVAVSLLRGASQPEVIKRLDDLLQPYGGIGAYDREDQLSNRYLSDEIRQLRSMALVAPLLFLSVAAFLLNVVLSRLIGLQREQIAALKAFGYSHWQVGLHYFKFVLVIVLVGVALGLVAGAWLGRGLTEMYTRFYRFPLLQFHLDARVLFLAVGISVTAGAVGAWIAVRRAMQLPPAEAMRPEPPPDFRPTVLERSGFQRLLSPATRMVLRQLERRPIKAFFSFLGIALAAAVLILGAFMEDSIDYFIEFQFSIAQRQDASLVFVEPASPGAVHELEHLPGVLRCEPFRSVPTRIRKGHRSRRVGVMGLSADAELYRLFDVDRGSVSLPPDGLVISRKLAELLELDVGESVTIEVLEGQRPVRMAPVVGLVNDFAGLNAYMSLPALHRLMREGDSLSGAFLSIDPSQKTELYRVLKETPRVAAVTLIEAALQTFRETVAENLMRIRTFNVIFASIIAIGVVYNNARISLSERSRELATLRVIGFTRGEISLILLGELAVLTLVGIPLGLGLGYLFAALSALSLDTEVYRIPLVVRPATYAFATTVVLVAALISGLIVRRKLDHLDLVAVLKMKE